MKNSSKNSLKSYLGIVPISARVHKRQSRMTRICIILAVFLVTALFSMADMWIEAQKTEMIRRHGDYHIKMQNVPEDKMEELCRRSDIDVAAKVCEIMSQAEKDSSADLDYSIKDRRIILYGVEETYLKEVRKYPMEGTFPQNDSEILLSSDAKELFGIDTGDSVTVDTPAGEFDYAVSGFCEDDSEFNQIVEGCCAYMDMETFGQISGDNSEDSSLEYYIRFQEDANLRQAIADVREEYGLSDENMEENKGVLGLSGASSSETAKNIYPLAAVAFVLILISGVLMISSCINSNVAQRTKFFGMLRCIGASREQIMRIVRMEALNWCKTAIPVGCILGVVSCWTACAVLRFLVRGEFVDMPLFGVSVIGIASGILVGIVTVFIAAHAPAKQAAKVSPVAAVSGNAGSMENVRHAADTRFFRVETTLGIHHAISAKKNLFLITGSFALSIILLLIFSAGLDIVRNLLPATSNFAPDVAILSQDNTNSIDRELLREISDLPGVEHAFGTRMEIAAPAEINGDAGSVDLMSYDEFMLDESKRSIASGNLSKVYGDSKYALCVFQEGGRLDVGDKVEIAGEELEIACVLSFGIGGVSGDIPSVICSEETYERLTGERDYCMINTIFSDHVAEETVDAVRNLAGSHLFTDRREEDSEVISSYWVFRVAAYAFLAIIAFITVLNIMNSISMSVSARIRQYGAMRAVGMENAQVTRMITAEAVTYAVCGSIAGLICGLLFHYIIYKKLLITHFGGTWKVPVTPIGLILLLVFVSCVAAVYAPAKRMRDMEITETINEL